MLTDSENSVLHLVDKDDGLVIDNWSPIGDDTKQLRPELVALLAKGYLRHKRITNYPNGGCDLYKLTDKGKAALY